MICVRVMQSRKRSIDLESTDRSDRWSPRMACFGGPQELPATSEVSEASEVLAVKARHAERLLSRPLTVLELEW